ncbi:MAG: BBP7 family outer membrane beta-barrel protein [Planctomycetota bacterium]
MTVNKITMWLAVGMLFAVQSAPVAAQFQDFVTDESVHDLQFFAPVDFDFEMNPVKRDTGWFFAYDKLSWAYTGERTEIGDPNQVVLSEIVLNNTPVSQGTPPTQYQINNSITDAPPSADFAWGERYEFGILKDGYGWTVGILDGPTVNASESYGFNNVELPSIIQGFDDNEFFGDLAFTISVLGFTSEAILTGSQDLPTSANGFGSVHVNFATPAGYLQGFRDYAAGTIGPTGANGQGPTVGGPDLQVIGLEVEDDNAIEEINLTTGGDGIVDDLDGDLLNGYLFILVDTDGDGVLDTEIASGYDFDDLHTFNIAFVRLDVRSTTDTQGVELMYSVPLDNTHRPVNRQNNYLNIGYGVRYLRLRDEFYWEGVGSVLGRTLANTETQNSIVGPQIRGSWSRQNGRWKTSIDGRCLLGYNVQDTDQNGLVGEGLAPGLPNRLASAQPNAVRNGRTDNDFSPVIELRAETRYQFTSAIAARLGYTAIFVDNITRASQVMNWSLPDYGILEGGQQDIFINGANFGFDVVY